MSENCSPSFFGTFQYGGLSCDNKPNKVPDFWKNTFCGENLKGALTPKLPNNNLNTPKWKKTSERNARRRRKKRRIVLKRVARIEWWVDFSLVKDFYLREVVVKFNVKFSRNSWTYILDCLTLIDLKKDIFRSLFFWDFWVSRFSFQGFFHIHTKRNFRRTLVWGVSWKVQVGEFAPHCFFVQIDMYPKKASRK